MLMKFRGHVSQDGREGVIRIVEDIAHCATPFVLVVGEVIGAWIGPGARFVVMKFPWF
jgi:hypothetical protein